VRFPRDAPSVSSTDDDRALLGAVLRGRYRVLAPLPRGLMGKVFRGLDVQLNRVVAVKLLADRFRHDLTMIQKFVAGAESLAELDHPNLIPVHAIGDHEGQPFFVMRYAEGRTLAEIIRSEGRLRVGPAARLGRQVCLALARVHEASLVHRDVKPQNIFVGHDDHCFLLDFGISRDLGDQPLQRHLVAGSPAYMPPEHPDRADARSDVYSLGVVLHEMVTGRLPFQAGTVRELILKHYFEVAPLATSIVPDLPPAFEDLLQRALARNPGSRFQSAEELAAALLPFATAEPVAKVFVSPAATIVEALQATVVPATPPPAAAAAEDDILEELDVQIEVLEEPAREVPVAAPASVFLRHRKRALAVAAAIVILGGGSSAAWFLTRDNEPPPPDPLVSAPHVEPAALSRPADPLVAPPLVEKDPAPAVPAPAAAPAPAPTPPVAKSPATEKAPEKPSAKPKKKAAPKLVASAPAAPPVPAPVAPPPADVRPARLSVTSTPSGATVRAGSRSLGTTPLQNAELAPGAHDIIVEMTGHRPWRRTLSLEHGEVKTISAELQVAASTLHVVTQHNGEATWATISVDGQPMGDTNNLRRQLPAGPHRISAKRSGYRETVKSVTMNPGETKKVILVLEKE
jgi:serine/threonine-protein kinase